MSLSSSTVVTYQLVVVFAIKGHWTLRMRLTVYRAGLTFDQALHVFDAFPQPHWDSIMADQAYWALYFQVLIPVSVIRLSLVLIIKALIANEIFAWQKDQIILKGQMT
jgi:hypothetical protein